MNCNISMVEGKLPPGFRFHPRDDELICDYLMKKLLLISSSSDESFCLLVEVDLNKCEPWDLPERACVGGKEWYFYSQRDRKYATGLRTNRATVSGYWKATGKDRAIARKGSLVGMRKTLVFYQGRAPKGRKTEWVMHEFRLEGPYGPPKLPSSKEDWVLCRVFHKSNESVPSRPTTTTANVYDESGCSSLPDLMDTFISFDQNHDEENEDFNNNNNNNDPNNLPYEQVSCFSNNNYNQTTPNSTSSSTSLFHVAPSQPITLPSGSAAPYHTPAYGNDDACDRHVIKAVLSHFSNDVKDSTASPSPVSMTAGSSQSYLSDVAFPTMWTHHY